MNYYCDKTKKYFQLQQQLAHCKRIIQVKKIIDFLKIQQNASTITYVKNNHKYQKSRNIEIKENNLRLFNNIMEINGKNRLVKHSIEKPVKQKKIKTQNNQNFTNKIIDEENRKLFDRLVNVKPHVGTIQKWEYDFKKSRITKRIMHKFIRNESINPGQFNRITLSGLHKKASYQNYTSLDRKVSKDINSTLQSFKVKASSQRYCIDNPQTANKYKINKKRQTQMKGYYKIKINLKVPNSKIMKNKKNQRLIQTVQFY